MTAKHSKTRGRGVIFTSARGGTGKTTLSSYTALLSERAGFTTALLDLDIQFGDADFIFDQTSHHTLLDLCLEANLDVAKVPSFAHRITPKLDLYVSGSKPEHADFVVPHAAALVRTLKLHYDIVVVNTGSFWTTLHAEAIEESSLCFLVFDARAVTLRTTVRVRELLSRLGMPTSKIAYVLNHTRSQNEIEIFDASMVLGTNDIAQIPYGGVEVSDLMSIGRAVNLLEEAPVIVEALEEMLREKGVLPDVSRHLRWMGEEPLLVGEQR